MIQFIPSIAFLDHNLHVMIVHLHTTPTTRFPVFFLLIAPDNTDVTSKNAEDALVELLKNADAPDIKMIHGVKLPSTNMTANDKLSRLNLRDRCNLTWI